MATAEFTFLGNAYTVSQRKQIINVKGPWPGGRKTFTRGYSKIEALEHDESAQHMLARIEKDLASFEVSNCRLAAPSLRTHLLIVRTETTS